MTASYTPSGESQSAVTPAIEFLIAKASMITLLMSPDFKSLTKVTTLSTNPLTSVSQSLVSLIEKVSLQSVSIV